jgi:ATP-dependent DNA helicase RecG
MSDITSAEAMIGLDIDEIVNELRRLGTDTLSVEVKGAAGGMPESIATTLSAFANTPGGGLVILGLDERSGFSVTRLPKPSELASALASIGRQALDPPVQLRVAEVPFEGKRLVVARVAEADVALKPCRLVRNRKAYLRVGDGDYELSRIEEEAFVVARSHRPFDEEAVPGSEVADLDSRRVDDFLTNVKSSIAALSRFEDSEILLKMGVITKEGVVTVAGLIALSEYPQQFLPAVSVRAALIPAGRTIGHVRALDDATFNGPIALMIEEAVNWVKKNSRTEIMDDRERGRVFNQTWPPQAAVRELVANAIVHRDLAPWSRGRVIELRMSSEEFRITNPGGLYGVTMAALGTIDLTSARNRRLVELCRYVTTSDGRAVEAIASGIPTVFAELSAASLPGPQFLDNGISFTAKIRGREVSERWVSQPEVNVPPGLQAVIEFLGSSSANVREIGGGLGISAASAAQRLHRLRSLGLVTSDGGSGLPTTYRVASRGAPSRPRQA